MKTRILSLLLLLCVFSPLAAQADEYSIGISNFNSVEDSIYYESFKDSIVRFRSEQPREVNPDTTSTAVGAMGGTFGVSATGGATYTIPIEVPQGIGGLQPQLSIVYNSQAGNGLCGYGAGLAGLSSITRGPKDIYHDGSADGINYWTDDAFYLDGVRLIHVSGTPGSYGTVYVPESDPFTRVITYGSSNSTSDNTWFEVQTHDGMIYWYGNSSASRLIYTEGNKTKIQSWNLSHVRQPSGNFMNLFYQTDNNCLYPSVIAYGNNLNMGTPLRDTIYFSYELRGDSVPIRFDGQQGSMRWRLKNITGKSDGSVFRSYTLNYNTTGDSTDYKYSRLVSITEKNAQNESLPSTLFSWSYLPAVNYSSNSLSVSAPSNLGYGISFPFSSQNLFSGDFNNDGLTDIVGMGMVGEPNGNGGQDFYTYAYIYYASRSSTGDIQYTYGQKFVLPPTFNMSILESSIKYMSVFDIDGDGINELIIPYFIYPGYGNGTVYIYVIGQNFPVFMYYGVGLYGSAKPLFTTGDINNDGRSDVIMIETTTYSGGYPLQFMQYNPDYIYGSQEMSHCLFDVSIETSLSLSSTPRQVYLTDMNGNGLNDLFIICSDGYVIYWNQGGSLSVNTFSDTHKITGTNPHDVRSLTPGDYNGDGLLDILSNTIDSNNWYFYLNKGDGTFAQTTALEMSIISDQSFTTMDDNVIFANVIDFDNDGRSDVIISKGVFKTGLNQFDYAITKWLTSTGTALVESYSATSYRYDDLDPGKYITGDFDGDGHMDIVNYGYDCVGGCHSNSAPEWRIYKNVGLTTQTGKVTSMTGDYGATTAVTYSTLTDSEVYSCEIYDSYPAPTYTIPLNVVKRIIQDNGAADNMTTQYSYESLKIHISGRGMIGFCETKTNCLTTGVITDNSVYQFHSELYIPKKRNTRTIIGNDVAERITTMTISNQGNKKFFAYPSQIEDIDFDGNTITTTRSFNTTYGYPTSETITYGTNMYRSISYSDYILAGGSYHPQTVVSSQRHPDHRTPFSKTTKYVYDNNTGSVISEVDNYGSSKPLTTNYTYDDFGNLTSKVSTGNGVTTPVTIYYTYDATHRFPVRIYTSPSSTVQKYTYDLWGDVLTEQDSINTSITNTVTHTYDAWGNLIRTQAPDGTETTYSRGWNNSPSLRWFILEQGTAMPWVKTWYDNRCREVKTESVGPMNVEVSSTTTYNSKGLVSGRTDSKGNLTLSYSYTYDTRGRLTSETAPGNHTFSYQYGNRTVTVTENGNRTTTKTYDAWGNLKTLTDPVSSITNLYASCGNIRRTSVEGSAWIFQYDDRGNRTSMTDPDAGTTTYVYDALGRETQRVDGRGVVFVTNYDYLGRVASRTAGYETITYTYGTSGTGQTRLVRESNGTWSKAYVYDTYGRVTQETMSYNVYETRSMGYHYNSAGLLSKRDYPNVKSVSYSYDAYGNCTTINVQNGLILWNLTDYTGSSTTSTIKLSNTTPYVRTTRLDNVGNIQSRVMTRGSDTLQYDSYVFNAQTGNLTSRVLTNCSSETFTYDNLDRLTQISDGNHSTMAITYAPNGNISTKNNMGQYSYSSTTKPHAVSSISPVAGIPEYGQDIEYTPWNKAEDIYYEEEGGDSYYYHMEYGPDRQRVRSSMYRNDVLQYKKFYWDDYEEYLNKTSNNSDVTVWSYWIEAPDGLAGFFWNTTAEYYTVLHPYVAMTDHLGSLTGLYDPDGNKTLDATYDAWGKRTFAAGSIQLDRGFTGHENLDALGLINMNGRMYDPLLGRFLSPDPYVQAPSNPQNFNRYSYCLNNPLKYTDPSGEIVWLPIIIGAAISGAGYTASVAFSDGGFDNWNWEQFGKSVVIGAISGAITSGIGQMFGSVGSMGIGGELARAYTHGFANGMISEFSGGDFIQGFAMGGLSSLACSSFMMYGGSLANSQIGIYAFSGLSGGISAKLSGGDFWQGTAIGLMTAGLNHLAEVASKPSFDDLLSNFPINEKGGELSADEVYDLIGGKVLAAHENDPESFNNACALRVSRALNGSNVDLPNIPGKTLKGSDGKNYFFRAKDLYNWMVQSYGKPISTTNYSSLTGNKGIYIMQANYPARFGAWGHATLYNMTNTIGNSYAGPYAYRYNLWTF